MSLSFAAHIANFMLRWKVKPRRGEGFDVAHARAKLEQLSPKNLPLLPGITRTPVAAVPENALPAGEWLCPEKHERTVLYLHGGGYFSCSVETHRPACAQIARRAQAQVFSVEYRLAPEHPFPAAIDDAVAAYEWLLESGIPPGKVVVAGDSAGGGLALACVLESRTRGLPVPAALVLFSPWTDMTLSGESMRTMASRDVMFRPDQFPAVVKTYLKGHDPSDPLASPLFADLAGLPPLMIWASEHEVLSSDATRLYAAVLAAGGEAELHLEPGLPHVWPIMVRLPESRTALVKVARFIAQRTGAA